MVKKLFITLSFVVCAAVVCLFCIYGKTTDNDEGFLRIHIRANSNLAVDQNVKFKVKNEVVTLLSPLLKDSKSFDEAQQVIRENLNEIQKVSSRVLRLNGFNYIASAELTREYFPTRSYGELVLDSGYYDALIINLGEAAGNNWWCVVYPPLCFVNAEDNRTEKVVYKSIILEIIKKYLNI